MNDIMRRLLQMTYGGYFNVNRNGIRIMVNGRMYSYFKGLNSGKWQVGIWDNIWRKTGEPLTDEIRQANMRLSRP